ncbi:MAG: exosortase A [Methylococcaceae bacterium]|nr:exosortase A [Methylococcaceae bacterium]
MNFLYNKTALYLSAILLLSISLYFATWNAMVAIWMRSETFTHGFFVIPMSLWLIWQNKSLHGHLHPIKPSYSGLIFLLLNGMLWLVGNLINALVIEQYALIGMLIGSLWFYLGNDTSKKLSFPLFFLYMMVPVGEALIPYLMEYTATFTIWLLRLTGISVYREGMHFTLVSGQWSVVEACSGLRYLLASFTLGTLYAYITYTKTYKRTIFILFSLIFPIIANGLRAYMIVMIGHLSDMQLATGVDHLIYGAVFFALVIFLMFYIGSFWKDPEPTLTLNESADAQKTYTLKQNTAIAISLVLALAIWPLLKQQLQENYHAQTSIPEWSPLTQNTQWQEVSSPDWGWRPKFEGTVNESLRYFKNKDTIIGLYQANFGNEQQGAELVSSKNVLRRHNDEQQLNERQNWYFIEQSKIYNKALKSPINFAILRNKQSNEDIEIIRWYQLGNAITNNDSMAKLYQLYKRLTFNNNPEIYYVVFMKKNNNEMTELPQYISSLLTQDNL